MSVKTERAQAAGTAGYIFKGTDLVASVTVPQTAATGTIIARLDINPAKFAGTTLAKQASLWSNWIPKKLQVEVQPSAGTTTSGTYLVGWTLDSSLDIPSGVNAIRAVSAFEKPEKPRIFDKVKYNISCRMVQRMLFCDGAREDSDQGTLYIVLSSGIGNLVTGSVLTFNVYLNYDIEFYNRLATPASEEVLIFPQAGYENYFTDSSSDWAAGTKLSLKQKEGGALVPWDGAVPEAIYQFKGTSLQYYDAATTLKPITHAVRIRNRGDGALAVFESLVKAQAYVSTGDEVNCLTFKQAGPFVTPAGAPFLLVNPPPIFSNSL